MKKIDMIHTAILIVALLVGYSAITNFLAILMELGYFAEGSTITVSVIVFTFLQALLYGTACFMLFKKGRRFAKYLLKEEPVSMDEDSAELQVIRRDLIFAVIIGLGLYTVISSIPYVAVAVFKLFRNKVAPASFAVEPPNTERLITELLSIILGVFLLYAAPSITYLIEKHASTRKGNGSKIS